MFQELREGDERIHSYEQKMFELYAEQSRIETNDYLEAHSHNLAVMRRDTGIFERYSHLLPEKGTILDWGCNHAPSSCLVKMLRGDAVQLYGCDVHSSAFQAFFRFANLRYTTLTHPYLLPYDDDTFDAVIGTAVLEHVPNDSESLKELYRILKPGGIFVMTTLPNRYSYTEWLNRVMQRSHHLRRYSLTESKHMLLHHGFLPIAFGYHQVFPSLCSVGGVFNSRLLNKIADGLSKQSVIAERIWPFRCFASNVFVVSKKVSFLHNCDFDIPKRMRKMKSDPPVRAGK